MDHKEISAVIASLGLTISAKFVPFSMSRNKGEKSKTLNWTVTLQRNGKDVMTFDYSAGLGHCPSYKRKAPQDFDQHPKHWPVMASEAECESGQEVRSFMGYSRSTGFRCDPKKPINPDTNGVLYSIVMDSSVLDAGGFENWASDYGFDTDSRKAEAIYKQCLEQALQLRAAIGESGIGMLQDAFEDY